MKYLSTKSCENLFRPSLKRKSFGVVWTMNDQEMWLDPHSSQLVCNVCVRKIKNCCDNLKLLSRKRFESDQKDNVGGEFEIV